MADIAISPEMENLGQLEKYVNDRMLDSIEDKKARSTTEKKFNKRWGNWKKEWYVSSCLEGLIPRSAAWVFGCTP